MLDLLCREWRKVCTRSCIFAMLPSFHPSTPPRICRDKSTSLWRIWLPRHRPDWRSARASVGCMLFSSGTRLRRGKSRLESKRAHWTPCILACCSGPRLAVTTATGSFGCRACSRPRTLRCWASYLNCNRKTRLNYRKVFFESNLY